MSLPSELLAREFLIATLVLVRIASLVAIAPLFGSSHVSWRVRGVLALALAALVVPLELAKGTAAPATAAEYLVWAGAEAVIGLALGLGILVLFAATHLAGQLLGQMSGVQLADVFNPDFDTSLPVFSQAMFLVTLAVFISIGGHRRVLEAMLDTFVSLPAGQGHFSQSITAAMTSVLTQSFALGIRTAAPALVALLLATLVLGLASRTLPQLNILAVGLGASTLVTLVAVGVSLGAAAWMFQDQLEPALETVLDAILPS